MSETKQLKQAQEFLQKQKQSIKKRRVSKRPVFTLLFHSSKADLMQAQKSWTSDQKKLTKHSSTTAPDHRSIAQQVQNKFDKVCTYNPIDHVPPTHKLLIICYCIFLNSYWVQCLVLLNLTLVRSHCQPHWTLFIFVI